MHYTCGRVMYLLDRWNHRRRSKPEGHMKNERTEKTTPDAKHVTERKAWTEPKLRKVGIAEHTGSAPTGPGFDGSLSVAS